MTLADRADAALQQLYDQVPDVGCKGLCGNYCCPVDGGARERARMARAGYPMPPPAERLRMITESRGGRTTARCSALTDDGRCAVYELRPMVCRLWGASEALPCPHGCRPVDGSPLLTDAETAALLAAATDLRLTGDQPTIRPTS